MAESSIEWTDKTWNPVVGCSKISQGCKFCYAEKMHRRLSAMGQEKYSKPFTTVRPWRADLDLPLLWKKPRMIFVNSMSDLFHEDVPFMYLVDCFRVMSHAYWHTFQSLTKRAERLAEAGQLLAWPPNVWQGVSVENPKTVYRIDLLRQTPALTRFLSIEPLLGPLPDLDLTGIDWVIVGGESAPKPRLLREEWVLRIRDQCTEQGVPFFFKQWGGRSKKETGRLLQGRTYDEMPRRLPSLPPTGILDPRKHYRRLYEPDRKTQTNTI